MEVAGAENNINLSLRPPSIYSDGSNSPYRSRSRYDIKTYRQHEQTFAREINDVCLNKFVHRTEMAAEGALGGG